MAFEDVLGSSGRELWDAVHDARDVQPHFRALLLNACRIADRLDELTEQIALEPVMITLYDKNGDEINKIAQPLFGEHRQQSLALRQILASMGIDKLDKSPTSDRTIEEALAEFRAGVK